MQAVNELSKQLGIAVVCTIHQPSKQLFYLFSHLVLLCKGGYLAYIGPTGDKSKDLVRYLEGIPCIAKLEVLRPTSIRCHCAGGLIMGGVAQTIC